MISLHNLSRAVLLWGMYAENPLCPARRLPIFGGGTWVPRLSRISRRRHEKLSPVLSTHRAEKLGGKLFPLSRGTFLCFPPQQSVNPLKYLRGLAFKKSLCFFSGFPSLFRFTFIETMYYIFLEWPSSVLLLLPPRLLPTRKGDTDRLSIHHLHHLIWRGMRRGRLWDYVTSHFVLFCLATRSLCRWQASVRGRESSEEVLLL